MHLHIVFTAFDLLNDSVQLGCRFVVLGNLLDECRRRISFEETECSSLQSVREAGVDGTCSRSSKRAAGEEEEEEGKSGEEISPHQQ